MSDPIVLTARHFRWCVYLWKQRQINGTTLLMYVGLSAHGVRRVSKIIPRTLTAADVIEVFPCASGVSARLLERKIIARCHPVFNRTIIKERIGKPTTQIRKTYSRRLA